MQSFITLALILLPMLVGFALPASKNAVKYSEKFTTWLVFLILIVIGIELSQVDGLIGKLESISGHVVLLAFLTIFSGIAGVAVLDYLLPWHERENTQNTEKNSLSVTGSLIQIACVFVGIAIGSLLPHQWLPPESTMTALLMILLFNVGIGLKGAGVTLKEVLLNKRGVQISLVFSGSVLIGGLIFALVTPEVSIFQGLALSAGFGWYSLSAIVMTDSYGAIWGSVALINDLSREFFALIFIPFIMRFFPYVALSVGGATSLDFTLPTIQQSGGIKIVPMTICFGFITNILSPVLMVIFSSLG